MKPVRFVESEGILICGSNGGDAGSAWHKWEEIDAAGHPELKCALPYDPHANPGAFEARFYPPEGEFDFVGIQMSQTEAESKWDYMNIPSAMYAVFDIDCKVDQNPQFGGINEWLAENNGEYKRFAWNADGQINAAEFVICVYDHTNKFAKEQIMEMWIPLIKI